MSSTPKYVTLMEEEKDPRFRTKTDSITHLSVSQNPNLNFKEVTYELDHAGFIIRDSKGLHIVVYGIQRGLGMEVFPVDLIYRPWKHAEGQVSHLEASVTIANCSLFKLQTDKNAQVYVVFCKNEMRMRFKRSV